MKTFYKSKKSQLISLAIISAFVGFASNVEAGGFQLFEENVTNLGNAYAGVSAQADDASTEFYNPAGMTRLNSPQFVLSGTYIDLDMQANVNSAYNTSTLTIGAPFPPFPLNLTTSVPVQGTNNIQAGDSAVVPSFHFVYPFCNKFAVGFGATAPFGLETEYGEDSIVRFMATQSSIQTVDIGPSIAYQFTPQFSLGAGLDSQYMSATFDQDVPIPGNGTTSLGGFSNEGDSWGWGWHAGALYQFTPSTRVGLGYHSQVKHEISGRALADLDPSNLGIQFPPSLAAFNALLQNPLDLAGNFNANVTLPGYADLSVYHDFNPQWAVLGGLEYTDWSVINIITANYSGTVGEAIPNAQLPFDFRNTWRASAGLNYKPWEKWTFKTGVAFDESPVKNDETRTFRLPDSNRYWLAFGAQYQITKEFIIDAGYAHLFTGSISNNNTQQLNAGLTPLLASLSFVENASASFDSSVNEVGLQLTWNIM